MRLRLSALFTARTAARPGSHPLAGRPRFRPQLEGFEDRLVPASPVLDAGQVAPAALAAPDITITGVNLTNLQIVNGVLHAAGTVTGTLAGLPFSTTISNFTLGPGDPTAGTCSILHLDLNPIHLNLLGLHVDTSPICLDITASHTGLLGNLLCGLTDSLPLGLSNLPGLAGDLGGALQNILGQVLGQGIANGSPGHAGGDVCTGQCEVLSLSLGPVDLSLLGLNVNLDNCANGPVQVCVSASRGEGLLGNLLCGLTDTRLGNLNLGNITQLGALATSLLSDGSLNQGDTGLLASTIAHLGK